MPTFVQRLEVAVDHLRGTDRVLRELVERIGPCRLKRHPDRFATVVHSIVAQQVSGLAAKSIFNRLRERLGAEGITAAGLANLDLDELRALGVSRQKATYLHDLAAKTQAGQVRFQRFGRMADEAVVEELARVKGIGRWTAQMFLIFSLGRLDVLPVDDFGIRTAIRVRYQLQELPRPAEIHGVAQPWRPFASVACWYLWRSLEWKE